MESREHLKMPSPSDRLAVSVWPRWVTNLQHSRVFPQNTKWHELLSCSLENLMHCVLSGLNLCMSSAIMQLWNRVGCHTRILHGGQLHGGPCKTVRFVGVDTCTEVSACLGQYYSNTRSRAYVPHKCQSLRQGSSTVQREESTHMYTVGCWEKPSSATVKNERIVGCLLRWFEIAVQ